MTLDLSAQDRVKGKAPLAMRPTLAGTTHMISAGHYLAAHAGFAILEAGGNAVDAGVAAGITLAVVQSDFVSFAGVAPILIHDGDTGAVWSIAGVGGWPRAATLEHFRDRHGGRIPPGLPRTVVPGAPAAWITALARFGTISFGDAAAAAIRFADQGLVMYPLMAEMITMNRASYAQWASNRAIYLPTGAPPAVGTLFYQRELAQTLQYMADQERSHAGAGRAAGLRAAMSAFYRGDIAHQITSYHAANDGLLAMSDLAEFEVEIEPALCVRFRGIDIHSCGFWCQGPVLLQMLNMLEESDLTALSHNSSAYIHHVTEVMKLAFADREACYGDPRYIEVPVATLLSKAYARDRAARIDPDAALPGLAPTGTGATPRSTDGSAHSGDGLFDTSYVCVIDRFGNAFSATPSDPSHSTPVIPGTGLCPSSRGGQSWARAGHPAAIAPGKRPRMTPNPALARMPGAWVMPFGTPGGDVQCQAMLQMLLNVTVFDMDLQAAIEAPRFACYSFPSSYEPHDVLIDRLMLEGPIAEVAAPLAAKGHDVQVWPGRNWRAGGLCAARHELGTGLRWAGADPRRPSYALGW